MWWIAAALLLTLVIGAWYVTAMPGRSHRGSLPTLGPDAALIRDRLAGHVRVLAGEIGERNIWHLSRLAMAGRHIHETMKGMGLTPTRQRFEAMGVPVENLEAELGGNARADEIIVVGAHYDSVQGCPGANDNGSGVAALLELARLLGEDTLARTVRFVAFVNEEPPFSFTEEMGSVRYAKRCQARAENVVAMLSLETMGYYSSEKNSQRYPFPFSFFYPSTGDFLAVVGNMRSRRLVRRVVGAFRQHAAFPCEGTAAPGYLPGIFWSDQWAFWRRGYPAVMITDTAPFRYPHYHTPEDSKEKVDYERLARVVQGLSRVVRDLASG